jgi:predicted ABC-type transport system involved in lysophospholipase L1 biosynthesis ATPase subunit
VVPGEAMPFMTNKDSPNGGEIVASSRLSSMIAPNHTGSQPMAATRGMKIGMVTMTMDVCSMNIPRKTTTCIRIRTTIGSTGRLTASCVRAGVTPEKLRSCPKTVAIARALAMRPRVMLFDEPTSALDPELVGEVLAVMRQLASEGMTMLSHEMGFAAHFAGTAVFMNDGRIVEQGPPAQLFAAPQSERLRAFLNTWRERSI